ncbi:MAG: hypothetical protein KH016_05805 [Haemophilus parainfluenzae]|jgi:hypothetical protein|uniref:CDI toxin immunity protein n=1 Tax=Haemophilus parainfluenzae TaxID=729 RepID=UPI00066A27BF|nr:hypothetical protein [Haemophilus parainfluenzae]MBS4798424.1 hypothetical protein [Haemophilus parainfluenzae]MBS5084941.1 hypothetical protein [Haemophilus parainfluenzae]
MTLFDECIEALSDDFSLLTEEEEKEVLNIFYKYPFEYGNIDKLKEGVVTLKFDKLIKLVEEKLKSSEVYVLADINGVPIFKTNLFLALEKIDDISALSTKVFLLGDGYLAQIVPQTPPLDIVALNS